MKLSNNDLTAASRVILLSPSHEIWTFLSPGRAFQHQELTFSEHHEKWYTQGYSAKSIDTKASRGLLCHLGQPLRDILQGFMEVCPAWLLEVIQPSGKNSRVLVQKSGFKASSALTYGNPQMHHFNFLGSRFLWPWNGASNSERAVLEWKTDEEPEANHPITYVICSSALTFLSVCVCYHHRGLVYGVNLNVCFLLCIPNHCDFSVTCVLSQLDTFSSKKAWLFVEIQGEVRIGVHSPLWALERVGLRGICFSFCQLEFPFQIPFWLYDQATAVFMGGHSLAGGADLVRKNFFFFLLKAVQEATAFSRNVAERVLIWGSWGPGSETRLHPSELCY